ncbi:hypothetical protein K435DRAFT_292897 [Dendrothele bispora CBS 962.96]|uniref:Integral membrane protein n=1 Tax=Dendrothele bispora (strain CBS 962.96) TaxID=1314807 RepID=A0A4S8MLC1_DENBC|nr:hypothetical protein K435DRAFT_292897 [Dendrothele bispora CBS 962.96]
MVNWSDPEEIRRDSVAFERLIFVVLGVVMMEIASTWGFELSLITGRRKFRWPLVIFFFFSRYCIVSAIIGLIISLTVKRPINCGALYIFNSWSGNMTLLCSSTSLMLRTIALWERKLNVVLPLGILCLGFWGILYRTMFIVRAQWDDTTRSCIVVSTSPSLLNVTFFFTMGFDFVILLYTFVALTAKHTIRTDLWKLLFRDGLIYFLVTFSANCIPAVLNVLNLNTPMNVIATIPAAVVSSIASCRAVMRLLEFNSNDSHYVGSVSISVGITGNVPTILRSSPIGVITRSEVLVSTEHIKMSDFSTVDDGSKSPTSKKTQSESFDLERGDVELPEYHDKVHTRTI